MLRVHGHSLVGCHVEEWRVESINVVREEMTALGRHATGFLGVRVVESIMLEAVRWYRRESGLGLGEELPQLLAADTWSSISVADDCDGLAVMLAVVRSRHVRR